MHTYSYLYQFLDKIITFQWRIQDFLEEALHETEGNWTGARPSRPIRSVTVFVFLNRKAVINKFAT